jgi:acetate kinase
MAVTVKGWSRMYGPILVLNAGSSSIKFSVFVTEADRALTEGAHGQVEGIGTSMPLFEVADKAGKKLAETPVAQNDHRGGIAAIDDWFGQHLGGEARFAAAGRRIVHGGARYSAPVRIDDAVVVELEELVGLAPLHQPHHLAAIRALSSVGSNMPQIACFDTAFRATQPLLAREFALPRALTAKGLRRYGFHGISYEYIMSVLPDFAPDCANGKIIIAHLGNGASLCAVEQGRSIATTMGFTPLDGLMMGTCAGALDPGLILYLLRQEDMSPAAVEHVLYHQSGLLGVSGISSDMRDLLASTKTHAREAVDLFVYRIGRELGSLVAALGGLDMLVFTAGIGEHAADIRARVCVAAA